MSVRSILLLICLVLAAPAWAVGARAEAGAEVGAPTDGVVRLRSAVCYATAPSGMAVSARAMAALRFDCARPPAYETYRDGWVWLKLRDPRMLDGLPAGWALLIDQTRFARMTSLVVARDGGMERLDLTPATVGDHWAPGGMLRMEVAQAGTHVGAVYVGYRGLDDLSLMRKLSAASGPAAMDLDHQWLGLMGIFAGAILSAFAYNLLIYTGQRLTFQRWYLAWSGLALAYGLCWTNTLAYLVPGFAGPVAVATDYLLVAGLIAAGNMFFLCVIEDGVLPRWLIRAGWCFAGLNMVVGLAAAQGWLASPVTLDRWLNLVFVLSVLCVATGIAIAVRARSRVVWFYLIGWTPVLLVFVLRVGRNFGLLLQDDAIDMATFAALAFESVALSLASADRFRLLGKQRDAAEQARKVVEVESETFRRAAQTDFLTGLGNRAAFQNTLRAMCDAVLAGGAPAPFMLLLIDVDHLKDINDRLGHDGGDMLLENVGRGLVAAAGGLGHVSRIGGDEFAILMPGDTAERQGLRRALEDLQGTNLTHAGRSWALSMSIGSACFPQDAQGMDVLVKNADLALYQAKQLGRRRLQEYAPPLRAQLDRRRLFSQEASLGIERGEFLLHYQPIVDLQTGIVDSHEALLRWRHPVQGTMTPAVFGDMLNERKAGLPVQRHVLDMALAALHDHPARLPRLSVNFTAAQLDGVHTAARLLARIRDHGIAPERLCVEVTEGVVLDRTTDEIARALGLLHDAGVTVALDDFGTGYASLIHLKHLPFDILKIDRSFTLGLFQDDGQSEEIVRAIIGLGHGLRKQVVAEGVETQEQRQRLAEMGCGLGQGYLFARPAPIETLVPPVATACAA